MVPVGGGVAGVFVHPRHQETGCGRLIMEVLEAEAASQGVGTIELDVSLPSRAFYERLGYTILEEAFIDVGQGESLAYWRARKSISAA